MSLIDEPKAWSNLSDGPHLKIFNKTSGIITQGLEFDSIFASYPNSSTEVYTYELANNVVATITVVYEDESKNRIVSVVRV